MRQTLCYIPEMVFGLPIFGWGLGLGLLLVIIVVVHIYQFVRHRKISDIGSSIALLAIAGVMLVFIVPNLAEPGRGIPIRGFGTALLIAIFAALFLVVRLAKRQNIAAEKVYSLCFWAVIAGIIGARIFYVTEYWETMLRFDHAGQILLRESLFSILNFAQGGLTVFGSVLGGMLGAYIFMRRNKMPVLRTFDIMAPSMVLGMCIGRIGCLMNGCCFGGVADVSWAITFPVGSPAHIHQIAHGEVFSYGLKFEEINSGEKKMLAIAEVQPNSDAESCGLKPKMLLLKVVYKQEGESMVWRLRNYQETAELLIHLQRTMPEEKIQFDFIIEPSSSKAASYRLSPGHSEVLPVHPTQIYSSILALLLCGTLLLLGNSQFYQRRGGLVFTSFMVLYSVGRFFIEIIRTDEDSFFGTGLTISQNVCIVVCVAGIALFVYICRRKPGA